jgi:NAD(P)H-nitrite reductase large subunit
VGKENFIPVEDSGETGMHDSDKKYLILGGGAAALEAAKAIRGNDRTGGITIISDEPDLPYNRPMLTKAMLSDFEKDQLAVEPQKFYDDHQISVVLNTKVTKIDTASKTVSCGGMSLVYDRLIYALGARCFIPPIEGADLPKVVHVRTTADVRRIQEMLPQVKTAVVIGGGVLGLEAAWSLKRGKIDVTVLQNAGKLLNRQLTEDASDVLAKVVADAGVKFLTDAETAKITDAGLTLKDGRELPADLVIISTGVRANVEIAKEAGIVCGKAVVVNEKMETSVPDVYAAGDCAEFDGVNYALWSQAVDQGKTAGTNASGGEASYETVDGALTFNGMGTSLYSIGDNGMNPDKVYRTVELKDTKRSQYEKYTFENNRLVGVILIGDTSRLAELTQKVKEHAKYGEVVNV